MASTDSSRIGNLDRDIAGTVCLVAVLPLLGPLFALPLRQRTDRSRRRLIFFICVVLLSLYPFGSCASTPPAHKADRWMTEEDALALGRVCPGGLTVMSYDFDLRLVGELMSLIFGVAATWLAYLSKSSPFQEWRVESWQRALCCAPIAMAAFIGIPLVYLFWRLRGAQGVIADVVEGEYYVLNEWGYGQVMAITVFAPVGVAMLCG